MKSRVPKVLHPVGGRPMLASVLECAAALKPSRTVVVIGHQAAAVRAWIGDRAEIALQDPPRGTGDAARCGLKRLSGFRGVVVILNGDTPLVRAETVERLAAAHGVSGATVTLATTRLADPTGYGRVVRGPDGAVTGIVEERDAAPAQRRIAEINTGLYAVEADFLGRALAELSADNAQGEYYLTDVVGAAVAAGRTVQTMAVEADEVQGVNSRVDLARVEGVMRARACRRWMEEGVTILDPTRTWIDATVTIGPDTVLAPGVWLEGATAVGAGCRIGAGSRVAASRLGDGVVVKDYCVIEEAEIDDGASVGPFAHLRPGSILRRDARVGNFVEMKNVELGVGSKANHLSYLGDAVIGARVNIGAGAITCNYDGVKKSRTVIEDGVFVGSDSQFVAPVRVGKGAVIAAGTTVTEDVPADALVIGRTAQVVKPGWAKRKRQASKHRPGGSRTRGARRAATSRT
ncbi:MAG: bifunctional UDP-N-acetylglucosamine diphosphorylase/glucosamine-1-phosphate N-acetyltransferase GlmU [Nitrospirae bacterium]|nr:bifunctional UDP-N-acetylglucosamine diphosphorylase/glucosamine-1-phosphate N-acetyltransferase GlmU [Nitrospirota bacterium]